MPNWCYNRVTFSGTSGDMENLVAQLASEVSLFDFNKVIPMPDELKQNASPVVSFKTKAEVDEYNNKETPSGFTFGKAITNAKHKALLKKYGHAEWYSWSTDVWGCKWNNGDEVELTDDSENGCISYRFDTPWGPPEGVYLALRDMYPEVHISWFYDEPGMEFSGYLPD
jgi:hypothetical protein